MDKQTLTEEKFEIDLLVLLDCSKLHFYKDKGNFISLEYEGNTYFNVRLMTTRTTNSARSA